MRANQKVISHVVTRNRVKHGGHFTVNTVILMLKWYDQPEDVKIMLKFLNIAFTSLFTAESVLKILASGLRSYFSDQWNIFDFITVIGRY